MNSKLRSHILKYANSTHPECHPDKELQTDEEIIDYLSELSPVYEETISSHRWYDKRFRVVKLDLPSNYTDNRQPYSMFIGFDTFYTTSDEHWSDMGLSHDPRTICEVERKTKTVMYYEKIK